MRPSLELGTRLNLALLLGEDLELLAETSQELEQTLEQEQKVNPYITLLTRKPRRWFEYEEPKSLEVPSSPSELESLINQARLELDGEEWEIAQELIYNVDSRGYLRVSVEEIAKALGTSAEKVEKVRLFIARELEPLGVCSKNLEEFLMLQLKELYPQDEELHRKVMSAIKSGRADAKLKAVLERLSLSPLSGDVVYRGGSVDVVAEYVEDEWYVFLYDDFLDVEVQEPQGQVDAQKLRRAKNLKLLLELRRESLRRIVQRVLQVQEGFLLGKGVLKSLSVKDVSESLGVSPSTVSRLVNRKHIKTPAGVYPLRFFFVRSSKGGLSTEEVVRLIKEALCALGEDATDARISAYLLSKGIKIARRTVNKYRRRL